jgi:hypothetical protein
MKAINILNAEESGSLKSAGAALRIIWFTGILCVFTVYIFFIQLPGRNEKSISLLNSDNGGYRNEKLLSQLLLSPEEALLSDKKSFVNGALRFQWHNQLPDLNVGKNRNILYDNIFKRKLQRLPRAQVPDFSIKPVPK